MNKKSLTITMLLALVSIVSFGATVQRTILSHKGQLTQYDANHWQDAITDAADGDTIYFTSGLFSGNLNVTKALTFIGAGVAEKDAFYKDTAADIYAGCATTGESTILSGDVIIAIPGSRVLTRTLMEGLSVSGSISVTEQITGLIIRRCEVRVNFSASAEVINPILESCFIQYLFCDNLDNPDIHNCFVADLWNAVNTQFTYNYLVYLHAVSNCEFLNCGYCEFGDGADYNTFVNCLYRATSANCTYTNCSYVYEHQMLTRAQLASGDYPKDSEGNVVGIFGGPAPFTLIPSQPYVSASSLTYSKTTKKLNVNVTVKQGK